METLNSHFFIQRKINNYSLSYFSTLSNIDDIHFINDDKYNDFPLNDLFKILKYFNVNENDLKNLKNLFEIIGILLSFSKFGVTKKWNIELKNRLNIEFKKLGLKEKDINNIFNYILYISDFNSRLRDDNGKDMNIFMLKNIDNGNEFILKLIELGASRDVILDDILLKDLTELLNLLGSYNYEELNKIIENRMNDLIVSFKNTVIIDKIEERKKRKIKIKKLNVTHYKKYLNLDLKIFINKCKIDSVNFFMNQANEVIELLPLSFKPIENVLSKLYNKNIDMLTNKLNKLEYNINSMKDVLEIKDMERRNFKKKMNLDGIRNMEMIIKSINEKITLSKDNEADYLNRINKFDHEIENPLIDIITTIINDLTLDLNVKQLMIEKATLEYDLT
jgi:hypothetical protein